MDRQKCPDQERILGVAGGKSERIFLFSRQQQQMGVMPVGARLCESGFKDGIDDDRKEQQRAESQSQRAVDAPVNDGQQREVEIFRPQAREKAHERQKPMHFLEVRDERKRRRKQVHEAKEYQTSINQREKRPPLEGRHTLYSTLLCDLHVLCRLRQRP
jgi:hypothetical protein